MVRVRGSVEGDAPTALAPERTHAVVAVVLAVGLVVAINLVTFAVLYDALRSDTPGLSENATQILSTAFGGIIGVLGGFIGGYRIGSAARTPTTTPPPPGAPRP